MLKKYQRKNNIKQGFTLIELLAILVVLSVIALIAVPNVNDIVNNSKKKSAESSAQMLAKAAESYFANQNLIGDSVDKVNLADETLSYTGDKPDIGYAFFDEDGRAYVKMYYNGYCIIRNYNGKVESDKISPDNCEIANMVSVTLYTNGGVLTNTDGWDVLEHSAIKVLESGTNLSGIFIEKPGYTFKGWYDENGTLVNLSNTIIEDLTVTARWEANKYTITLDLAGGIIDGEYESTKIITYGESYGELPNPSKPGYTFKGWYTSSGIRVEVNTVVSNPSNHTLYANYEANKYTLTFKYNDNVTNDTEKTVIYGESYGELPEPSRAGYTFQGWFTEITGGTKLLATNMVTTTSNHTLYAQWGVNVYTLTFVYNNGLANTTKTITYGAEYGELPEPTKPGYTFTGWYTSGGVKVLNIDKFQTASNQELYAQWQVNTYEITFKYNDGITNDTTKEVIYDGSYGSLPTPSRTGYTFNGWYDGSTKVESTTIVKITANQTLTASWSANTYEITFESNGGTSASAIIVTYGQKYTNLPTTTKVGHTFNGWATSGGVVITSDSTVSVTSDTKLYAQWSVNSYLVTFDANGGSVTTQNTTVSYGSAYGSILGELPTPTRVGYTFNGWYTAKSSGTVVTTTTIMNNASNHSVYASWTGNKYTVTFAQKEGYIIYYNVTTGYTCTENEYNNNANKLGNSGCLKFYLLENNDKYVSLILDHNTTNTIAWNTDKTGTTPDTVNAQLAIDTSGWKQNINGVENSLKARLISANEIHKIAPYSSWNQTDTSTWYYLHYGSRTQYFGISGSNKYAWLLDNTYQCLEYGCNVANDSTYGYWTSSFANSYENDWGDTYSNVWAVRYSDQLTTTSTTNSSYGIRPVIDMANTLFETKEVIFGSEYGELPSLGRTGYTFAGWYTTGGVKIESSSIVNLVGDHMLYPQWTKNKFTITFDANGGTIETTTKEVAYDSTYGTLPTPTRENYDFDGWSSSANGGSYVSSSHKVTLKNDITLYAQWRESLDYSTAGTIVYFNVTTGKTCSSINYTINSNKLGNSGCLKFYTIGKTASGKRTLILDHNTTSVINWYEGANTNKFGPLNLLNHLQTDTANWTGVNTPKNYIDSRYGLLDYTGYKARILTQEDVIAITGVSAREEFFDSACQESGSCSAGTNKYDWLFDNTSNCTAYGCNTSDDNKYNSSDKNLGYWLSTSHSNYHSMGVFCAGYIFSGAGVQNGRFGVRPVIEIN